MALIEFLLRSSWQMLTIAVVSGFLSGVSSASVVALMNRVITQGLGNSAVSLLGIFIGLVTIALVTSIISQMVLIRLSQQAIFQLRLSLSRQILAAELTHLESLGAARLLAILTDDVQAVADAARFVPFICIDLAIVVGCFLYIAWLSWQVLLLVGVLLTIVLIVYRGIMRRAKRQLALARDEQDVLFQHFRAVTDGTKELKLHYPRRQAFLQEDLRTTAAASQRYFVRGFDLFAVITNWGKLIFFFAIGLVLFLLPHLMPIAPQAYSGYLLAFLFLIGPMESLISRLPVLSRSIWNCAIEQKPLPHPLP
jgi:putative ATP-binding cassette transporter